MTPRSWRRRGRAALGMALSTAVAGAVLAGVPAVANADPAPHEDPGIGKHDEERLLEAKQRGQRTVTVLVATEPGAAERGAEELTREGAKVEYRADELGYVRAEVPVDKVEKLPELGSVNAVDVDDEIPLPDPRPEGAVDPTPQPPPDAATPRVNPYLPTGETGAAQFTEANPKWDGRDVTVGIVDTGIDLDHPSLNVTSTGERKVTDWVTYTDSRFTNGVNNDNDPTWIDMSIEVTGGTFGAAGGNYTAPGTASYRFGVFNERDPRLGGELGNDVNRDGNPAGSDGTFGVLWDPASNTVWVDANQNHDFTDDKAMTDYKVRYDVGTFGTDDPATPVREAMPYVVQTDPANKSVNIGVVSGAHGSHVAGIVAGNELFGGAMSGAAPGAKLVSVRVCLFIAGCTSHALLEGMIYAARDAGVDVINMSIGGLPALNDGNNARAELYNRLIDTYGVQMFISAGNSGSGSNTVGDPSVADKVMSVGSYVSKATWQRNYGSDAAAQDNLHGFSSRGPREDGGFKPNIIAPGAAISPVPTWQAGGPVAGTYQLPPGYAMFNGTSMAAPQAAGAAALLVSAARARDVEHAPAQLRGALSDSARFIPGYQAYEQGNGLIDVGKAWNLLKSGVDTVEISSSVPVNTVLSPFLGTPGVGVGIHDREGVRTGERYVREYTFVRHSGPNHPVTYKVGWVGNDGTFSSPATVQLRKGYAAKFRVTVNPRSAGAHSAILTLDSPTTTGVDFRTLNTVIAAEEFTAQNGFAVRHGGQIGRNEARSFFVRVEPNTPALKVDLQGGGDAKGAGQIRFLRFHPYGIGLDSNSSLSCYHPVVTPNGSCATGSPTSRTVADPAPGVWEIVVDARRTSDAEFAPYTITASVLGAEVSPNPDVIESAAKGAPVERQYTLKNLFGPFTGRAAGTAVGSAKLDTPSIADGAEEQFPVRVEPGATQLKARIGSPSDVGADLDLFLFNCTSGNCVLAGQSADGDSEEQVTVANPAAGDWRVVVQGYAVPAGTTTYEYLDVFSGPGFGSVSLSDTDALRPAGAQWTVNGTVTANTAPTAGRVLLGQVEVRTDGGVLVGSGDVIVRNVTGS
ncbi:Subtilase family protein [Amycolatopsis arida]|uniref:Subtilase family protein n=1 Tax=Amycolatopsis arida TaxID=587909 RepID=A0A1I5XR68_9PSEU|nr:S8 family serine peptidase [Amycolatopsis arida]TDX97308.1 subtilase family protein [Amycolatopsis arida]SFQ34438.1 Subtilase family protein [Amycolatopsis arida]